MERPIKYCRYDHYGESILLLLAEQIWYNDPVGLAEMAARFGETKAIIFRTESPLAGHHLVGGEDEELDQIAENIDPNKVSWRGFEVTTTVTEGSSSKEA